MSKRVLLLLPIAVFAVLVGAFIWGLAPDRDPRRVPSAMVDKPAPDFDLPSVVGLEIPGLKTGDLNQVWQRTYPVEDEIFAATVERVMLAVHTP